MTQEPDAADGEQGADLVRDVIAEALALLAELDNTPLTQMTPLFYQHSFEELRIVTGDLLRVLGTTRTRKAARSGRPAEIVQSAWTISA